MSLPREFNFSKDAADLDIFSTTGAPLSSSFNLPGDGNPINETLSASCGEGVLSASHLSVQSAPLEPHPRPSSLLVDVPLVLDAPPTVPLSPSELAEEESLLTLSSVTARPLLAASAGLRGARGRRAGKRGEGGGVAGNEESFQPPDGGYGWVVVLGAFMVQFWVAGLFKSYGVLYIEIMETFPESSASVASWIPAILSTLCLALAPVSSALCEKYSCRSVVFVGGLFCAAGLASSYCATSLLHLLLTFGIMTGIGGGLSTTPGIVIVSQYFDKHRALANGICVSGTAAGSFVFPMLIEKLVDNFGFHGTILLLGGGMLHVCVSATLYRTPGPGGAPRAPEPPSTVEGAARPRQQPLSQCTTTTTEDTTLLSFGEGGLEQTGKELGKSDSRLFISDEDSFLNHKNVLLNDSLLDDLERARVIPGDTVPLKLARSNLLTEIFHPSLIEVARPPPLQMTDSEDSAEGLDVLGSAGLPRHLQQKLRLRPTRSSSLLHSVEDLSTDSTCVYKARGRVLSRSMYIKPPPVANRLHQNKLIAELNAAAARIERDRKPSSIETIGGDCEAMVEKSEGEVDSGRKRGKIYCYISRYLDVSLLSECRFALICASVALMSAGSPYALYYLPAYTVAAGHSKAEAGRLVAISAVLDLCGRLGLGWLCDLHLFDRKKAYTASILVAGIAVLTLPHLRSWWLMAVASGCYGLCLGCWFLLVPVLLADIFGTARISSSYGLVRLFQSIAAISVPPLSGLIRDLTGGYEYCFYGMGSCMVLGTVPVLILGSFFETEEESGSTVTGDEEE